MTRFQLADDRLPTAWFNILPRLSEPLDPPLHPATRAPVGPDDLAPLFPMALIGQEMSADPWIDIPGEVLDILRLWRPTPLVRAERLEAALGTPARIYFKDESVSPAGSHKPNTAVAQAFYNAQEGSEAPDDRDGCRAVGHGAVVRLRPVRHRVHGVHGAGLVRAEAVSAHDDGGLGWIRRAVTDRRSRSPWLVRARPSATPFATASAGTIRTTPSVRCSTTCCCTRP